MKILVDRDELVKVMNLLDSDAFERICAPASAIVRKILQDNPVAAEDLDQYDLVVKDEYGRVFRVGDGVSPKVIASDTPLIDFKDVKGKVVRSYFCDGEMPNNRDKNKYYILDIVDMLIDNEKDKMRNMGIDPLDRKTELLASAEELKDRILRS